VTPAERPLRRPWEPDREATFRLVLRLLPAGYRQLWEEDMVSAYLSSVTDSPQRAKSEWLAVVWLALRLRLNGSHASPRAQLWYQTVLGIAMLTTLYESLTATFVVVDTTTESIKYDTDFGSWWNAVAMWLVAWRLVWVATFVCLVLGRVVAARVLVLVAMVHEAGFTSWVVGNLGRPSWGLPGAVLSNMHQAWLGLAVVAVFLVPKNFRPSRGWLAAYLVPAAVLASVAAASVPDDPGAAPSYWLSELEFVNTGTLLNLGMIVGMVVALTRARRWLLPLAAFGGGVAAVQLVGYDYGTDAFYTLHQSGSAIWACVDAIQLVLAVVCVVVGVLALRRLPNQP
jgi:hypothetical protein